MLRTRSEASPTQQPTMDESFNHLAIPLFLLWWAAWGILDWMFEPRAPKAHLVVIVITSVLLGLYVHFDCANKRTTERARSNLADSGETPV